jgi:hypothetical protein
MSKNIFHIPHFAFQEKFVTFVIITNLPMMLIIIIIIRVILHLLLPMLWDVKEVYDNKHIIKNSVNLFSMGTTWLLDNFG